MIDPPCDCLHRKPLSERPYLKHIGLRSPVAWIVASLADIQVSRSAGTMCFKMVCRPLSLCVTRTYLSVELNSVVLSCQNGDVVLDPMCGAGTILVEGYTSWRVLPKLIDWHVHSTRSFPCGNKRVPLVFTRTRSTWAPTSSQRNWSSRWRTLTIQRLRDIRASCRAE